MAYRTDSDLATPTVERALPDALFGAGSVGLDDLREALNVTRDRLDRALKDRERLKRDLHDGILQSLYAVGLGLQTSQLLLPDSVEQAATQLSQTAVQLNRAITEIRAFLKSDPEESFEPEGNLETSLRTVVTSLVQAAGVGCRLDIDPEAAAQITADHEPHLLHIAQEAVSNALRHGRARTITVSLKAGDLGLRLEVQDDGVGFNPRKPSHRGFGLRNLSVRAAQMGGCLKIESEPWRGTRVVLNLLPMSR
ncbi:sensor histidine kinase [Candidatus Nitrospira bockiana]